MKPIFMVIRQKISRKKAKNFYEKQFFQKIKQIKAAFSDGKDRIALLTHAGYLLQLGGTRIAVDIAPIWFPLTEESKQALDGLIDTCDGVLLTHDHGDHYDRGWLEGLSVPVYVPDFLEVAGATPVADGEKRKIGNVLIRFFAAAHVTVPEYGFCVESGEKRLLFPGDIRDYSREIPNFGKVSAVFAHLWLGKDRALQLKNNPCIPQFCQFAKQFGAEKIFLAHLDDPGRNDENMWSDVHFRAVKKHLPEGVCFRAGDTIGL